MMRTPHESSSNFKGDNVNKKIAVLLLSIMAIAATTALAGSKNPMVGGQEMYPTKDIIDNAVNSADHTTLVAAVKAAGLVDTLKGPGPFTVFAPTNEAFAKLPAGTVENLLKPENKGTLVAILTYHVVPGKVMAKDVVKLHEAKTVNGKDVTIMAEGGKVMVGDANVVKTDIACSNGVIHVIDSVLLPQ